jgi:hypothetical protein
MSKKLITLALGMILAFGLVFCKKEEAVVEEKVESVQDAAVKTLTEAEKKAMEAAKAAEAEVKKKASEGTDAAKDALKSKMP